MSAKSSKGPAKKPSVPRSMAEIQSAYQQMCANLGQVDYQIAIQNEEKARLQGVLKSINNEAAARQQLDREEAAKNQTAEVKPQTEAPAAPVEA